MSDRDNSGTLGRNKDKNEEHPNWPDYTGRVTVSGVEYYLSGWAKTGKDGGKFMSLAFKPKDAPAGQKTDAPKQAAQKNSPMPF